ncbi:hypothetical protein HG531_013993 [Fusarium graminearum]|nr:hypothetical protein HG531_013993 [Fusarium graminearum]
MTPAATSPPLTVPPSSSSSSEDELAVAVGAEVTVKTGGLPVKNGPPVAGPAAGVVTVALPRTGDDGTGINTNTWRISRCLLMEPFRVCNVVDVQDAEILGESDVSASSKTNQYALLSPSRHKDKNTICSFGEITALDTCLGDVAISSTAACTCAFGETVDTGVDVARMGELKETLEIYTLNIARPVWGSSPIEVSAKVPTQAELWHRDASSFSSTMDW